MYLQHFKGIFFTMCIVLVCALYIKVYVIDLASWRRGLADERTHIAKYSQSDTRELIDNKFELDLEEFLPGNNDFEIKKNFPANIFEGDSEKLPPVKKSKRIIGELLPAKKNELDVEKHLPGKKDEPDAEKLLQVNKDNRIIGELLPAKKGELDVKKHLPGKKDEPDVEKLLEENKDNFDVEKILPAKKVKLDDKKHFPGKKDETDVEKFLRTKKNKLDVEKVLQTNKSEPDVAGKLSFEPLTKVPVTEFIRKKLLQDIANIEDDVLTMNVKPILKSMHVVPLEENRLIHKIQRAQRDPDYQCVIRIAKYCATRCHHYITYGHTEDEYFSHMTWKMFRCDVAKPCQVETRFVGNLTREIMDSSDVVLFIAALGKDLQLMRLIASRPPGQLWTLYSRESPHHDSEYAPTGLTGNPFNLTMTHSRQADIYFPYCTIKKKQVHPPPLPKKTKLIAWMASNCHLLSWRRGEFVEELQNHLAVDAYGMCGSLGPLSNSAQVLPTYKFYLALENSECRDYITEKLWKTCLLQGIVPIVYGAKREDYEQALPKNSFIYIEDFSNMSAFVDYIHELDSDNAQYEKYFDWRAKEQVTCLQDRKFTMFSPETNMWYLFRKLIHLYIHPETSWQKKTPNFASWWRGQCPDLTTDKNVLGFNVHRKHQKENKQGPILNT